ncbi:unnamed protein product [Effrenium voratum]|nr:unnamed protein product [Effrenium voratum]
MSNSWGVAKPSALNLRYETSGPQGGGFIVCNNKKFCGDSLGRPSGRDLVEILNSVLTCNQSWAQYFDQTVEKIFDAVSPSPGRPEPRKPEGPDWRPMPRENTRGANGANQWEKTEKWQPMDTYKEIEIPWGIGAYFCEAKMPEKREGGYNLNGVNTSGVTGATGPAGAKWDWKTPEKPADPRGPTPRTNPSPPSPPSAVNSATSRATTSATPRQERPEVRPKVEFADPNSLAAELDQCFFRQVSTQSAASNRAASAPRVRGASPERQISGNAHPLAPATVPTSRFKGVNQATALKLFMK